jgi:hypothetical protein
LKNALHYEKFSDARAKYATLPKAKNEQGDMSAFTLAAENLGFAVRSLFAFFQRPPPTRNEAFIPTGIPAGATENAPISA